MEGLLKAIPDFLKINLVYIIGIIFPVISALWAYQKFLYENKLQKFKDANADLFKANNQEVLAAIATLGVFRRDRRFKKNTIDVLLSRLYTELDYDITNAIANTLIQYENPKELKYIADELLGINRNFFFQTDPIQKKIWDLQNQWREMAKDEDNQSQASETASETEKDNLEKNQILEVEIISEKEKKLLPKGEKISEKEKINFAEIKQKADTKKDKEHLEIEKANLDEIKKGLLDEYLKIIHKSLYELAWHKQVTGDTYSRIMRRASRESKLSFFSQNLQKLKLWQTKENRKPKLIDTRKKLKIGLYQNDFNYTHLARINTSKCFIDNSALSQVVFTDIVFSELEFKDSTFSSSQFRNCTFKSGDIIRSTFIECTFDNVTFESINFKETFLWGSYFSNCQFIKCEITQLELFFGVKIDDYSVTFGKTKIGSFKGSTERDSIEKSIKKLNFTKARKYLMNRKTILIDKGKESTDWLDLKEGLISKTVDEWLKEKWLEMVDFGGYSDKFSESWDYISAELKFEYTNAEEWHSFLQSLRKEFGEFKSRKLIASNPSSWEAIVIVFESSFTKLSPVLEMVELKLEKDEKWRISKYTIK